MAKMDLSLLKSKFRGSMLGALIGDCTGSPYDNEGQLTCGTKLVLQKSFDKLEGPIFKAPVMQFTDDSAMTYSLAKSLVEQKELDIIDIAKRFVKSYYEEPNRGYGMGVVTVFQKLRGNKFTDIESPAKEQFNGQGSWGNGGAMRIAPIALFSYQNYDKLLDTVRKVTQITHTHKVGIDGAILQATAIYQSLHLNPNEELNVINFIDDLINKMDQIEKDEEGLGLSEPQPYKIQLAIIKSLISENNEGPHDEKVIQKLGNSVAALYSVPTAIFCFLRAQKPIIGIQTENPFRRAIQYAISLGGDTDTIGSMTGAIAGAFYGEEKISNNLLQHCEASEEFKILGDKLFEVSVAS
ncbi:ADP-ribose glycohydrolase ARH3-like [Apis dorsata]|uniref:ADP-ribose glycohydrolase ARH3-like n=1 Tax=Apis dorsata TaxID=7462 RepID=UPI0003DF4E7E|nr:ADP-ribose glycohydrolase ARH3-like [Apis dorsata]XP_006623713.1 ADP-ribose glycohydrolase ARH3-like [Apis dorsata]XP_031370071.1 ADP-ribose glycohydrolase ARH3-like [Apis dorsata]